MKKAKILISLLLAFVLLISLAACAESSSADDEKNSDSSVSSESNDDASDTSITKSSDADKKESGLSIYDLLVKHLQEGVLGISCDIDEKNQIKDKNLKHSILEKIPYYEGDISGFEDDIDVYRLTCCSSIAEAKEHSRRYFEENCCYSYDEQRFVEYDGQFYVAFSYIESITMANPYVENFITAEKDGNKTSGKVLCLDGDRTVRVAAFEFTEKDGNLVLSDLKYNVEDATVFLKPYLDAIKKHFVPSGEDKLVEIGELEADWNDNSEDLLNFELTVYKTAEKSSKNIADTIKITWNLATNKVKSVSSADGAKDSWTLKV